jgi:hypothetical protein
LNINHDIDESVGSGQCRKSSVEHSPFKKAETLKFITASHGVGIGVKWLERSTFSINLQRSAFNIIRGERTVDYLISSCSKIQHGLSCLQQKPRQSILAGGAFAHPTRSAAGLQQ